MPVDTTNAAGLQVGPPADPEMDAATQSTFDETRFSERVRNMIGISKKHKEERKHGLTDYTRRNQLYHGETEDNYWGRNSDWQSRPKINMVKPVVDTIVANVLDARPQMHFVPKNDQSAIFADLMKSCVESVYEDAEGPMALQNCYDETERHGIGGLKITFQPEELDGLGKVIWDALSPRQCYWDPNTTDPVWLRDCGWFIEANVISMRELKRRYPDKAPSVQSGVPEDFQYDKADEDPEGRGVETPVAYPNLASGGTNSGSSMQVGRWGTSEPIEDERNEEQTVLLEVWMLDGPDPETGEAPIITNPGLQNEWKVYWFAGADFKFMDWQRQPYRHQMLPYIMIPTQISPDSKYGEAEPDILEGSQVVINNLVAKFIDIHTVCGNPNLVISETSGLDTPITNEPGQILRPNSVEDIAWLQMPNAGAGEILAVVQTIRSFGQVTSGVLDVMLGERPRGVTTAEGLRTLEERALMRLRPRVRILGRALRRAWLMMTSLVQQYYTQERFLAKAAATPDEVQFVRLNQPVTPQMGTQLMRQGLPVGIRYNEFGMEEYFVNDVTHGEFDIRYAEGPGIPPSRTERLELALRLRESPIGPAISRQSLLRAVDWPSPEKEMMKLTQEKFRDAQEDIKIQTAVAMAMAPVQAMEADQKEAAKERHPPPQKGERQIFSNE